MSEDLKSQLAKAAKALNVLTYCNLSIQDTYERFCNELAGRRFKDKRAKVIRIEEHNFPKLVGMKRRDPTTGQVMRNQNNDPVKAKASIVIPALKAGTYNRDLYWVDYKKLRTMFWIPDAIENADAIYPNCHGVVEGDEVHIKEYSIRGANIKLVFTNPLGKERVVITSFLVKQNQLETYVGTKCIWP